VRGGSNISPVEVESALLEDSAVADAAVVGLSDAELGQRVGAALVLKQNEANTAWQEVLERVRFRLLDYKIPEKVLLVDAIPRNALTNGSLTCKDPAFGPGATVEVWYKSGSPASSPQ
jgi:long-chain acyl-CoA synthetase